MEQDNKTRQRILHVLAIGGSGLRVLKAGIMQCAAGLDLEDFKIKPYIVDPHLDSKEMEQISDLLRSYKELNDESKCNGFFRTPIEVGDITDINVMKTKEINGKTFEDFTGYQTYKEDSPERYLIDMLYSTTNLEKSMSVGFKGSPNVGTVVFEMFVESNWFQNQFVIAKEDVVVLIGSVFGGTGASGIPTIAKAIKSKNANIPVYAIPIMPYFKLGNPKEDDPDRDINSEIFGTKALAALAYYKETNESIDGFYVIGDQVEKEYTYDEKNQGNDAHLIELVAATALYGITSSNSIKKWNIPGVEKMPNHMHYKDFGKIYNKFLYAIGDFYIFTKFFKLIKGEKNYPFNAYYRNFYGSDKFETLENFMDRYFIPWLGELRDNQRSFNVIDTTDIKHTQDSVTKQKEYKLDAQVKVNLFNGEERKKDVMTIFGRIGFDISYYLLEVNNIFRKKKEKQVNPYADFVNTAFSGIHQVNDKYYNLTSDQEK